MFLMSTGQRVSLNIENCLKKETSQLFFLLESKVLVNWDLVPGLLSCLHTYDTKHHLLVVNIVTIKSDGEKRNFNGVLPYCIKEEYKMNIQKTQAWVLGFWGKEHE